MTQMVRRPEAALASSMALRVSLVNLQKLTLWAWLAPASMRMLAPAQNTRGLAERSSTTRTCGMLEAEALEGVGQLDVDAEVVGVELELVAFEQAALLVHVHGERRDVAVDRELPMPIARRLGREIDPAQSVRELVRGFRHSLLRLRHYSIFRLNSVSLPGWTGQSSTPGRWLLDRPVKPGDDRKHVAAEAKKCPGVMSVIISATGR